MTKHTTKKSIVYAFDGYSPFYGAFVQGAFTGQFIVPIKYANLVVEGNELETLRSMHAERRFGIRLVGGRTIQ